MNSGLQAWQTLGVLLAPWIRIWKAVGTAYSSSSSGGGDATRNTVSAPVRTLTISCTVQRSVQTCEDTDRPWTTQLAGPNLKVAEVSSDRRGAWVGALDRANVEDDDARPGRLERLDEVPAQEPSAANHDTRLVLSSRPPSNAAIERTVSWQGTKGREPRAGNQGQATATRKGSQGRGVCGRAWRWRSRCKMRDGPVDPCPSFGSHGPSLAVCLRSLAQARAGAWGGTRAMPVAYLERRARPAGERLLHRSSGATQKSRHSPAAFAETKVPAQLHARHPQPCPLSDAGST